MAVDKIAIFLLVLMIIIGGAGIGLILLAQSIPGDQLIMSAVGGALFGLGLVGTAIIILEESK